MSLSKTLSEFEFDKVFDILFLKNSKACGLSPHRIISS